MDFYVDPAFFILSGIIALGAFALGINGKRLDRYGFVASCAMLALLFSKNLMGLGYLAAFLAVSVALSRWVLSLFRRKDPHAVRKYRLALVLQIAPLALYKASAVFDAGLFGFIGISYITFKAVQVLIETRDGLIQELPLLDYLYFLSFFPTFTSGPIMRSRTFCNDIHTPLARDAYLLRFYRGAGWLILGALYKFIGASLALWLMWFGPSAIGSATPGAAFASQVVYGFAYGLDLFFDFAGYSDMAMGLGFMMGVEVPRNFRAPFASIDIKDFWNRWHITLSYWLRDFIFMRFAMAASKHKWFKSRLSSACCGYMINMTVMGFWHGITPDYICYGIYHGVLLALCELIQKKWGFYKLHKGETWFKACSWAVTMILVFFSFALFSGQVFSLAMGGGA